MVGSSKPYVIVSYCCTGENSLLIIPFNLWSNFMLWYSLQSFSTYLRNAYRDVPDSALRIQLCPGLAKAIPSQNVCSGCRRKTVNKKIGYGRGFALPEMCPESQLLTGLLEKDSCLCSELRSMQEPISKDGGNTIRISARDNTTFSTQSLQSPWRKLPKGLVLRGETELHQSNEYLFSADMHRELG